MSLPRIGGFSAPATADFVSLTYDDSNRLVTMAYKQGGSSGDVVGVLNITYVSPTSANAETVYWS